MRDCKELIDTNSLVRKRKVSPYHTNVNLSHLRTHLTPHRSLLPGQAVVSNSILY
jgi:hypothetical protein